MPVISFSYAIVVYFEHNIGKEMVKGYNENPEWGMEERKTRTRECIGEMPQRVPQGAPRRTPRAMPQGMLREMARGMPTGF